MKDAVKITGIGLLGLAVLFCLWVVGGFLTTLGSVATAPGRVITKTLDTNNIISSYEFFHDANNQAKARVAQIAGHKAILKDTIDSAEKSRLRIELSAIQQGCRDLVGKYNANATKTNKSIFMGREAPESLNPAICE